MEERAGVEAARPLWWAVVVDVGTVVARELVDAPLVRVKLILQTQDARPEVASGELVRYSGAWDVLSKTVHDEGIVGLWAGAWAGLLIQAEHRVTVAMTRPLFLLIPRPDCADAASGAFFWSAFFSRIAIDTVAGAIQTFAGFPLSYCRARLLFGSEYSGVCDCLARTAAKGHSGAWGCFGGFSASVVGAVVYRLTHLLTYGVLNRLNPWEGEGPKALVAGFVSSQMAALVASLVAYPLTTISRRLQLQADLIPNHATRPLLFKGPVDCLVKTVKTEGLLGLYNGALVNQLRGLTSVVSTLIAAVCRLL